MSNNEGGSTGLIAKIKGAVDTSQENISQRRIEQSDFESDEIEEMAGKARGDAVTEDRIIRIARHLDRDERPQYLNKGGAYFGLRIEGGETEIRKGNKGKGILGTFNNVKGNVLIATDTRVLIVSMQTTGDDTHSIPYESITGVDSAKGFPVKITIQTHGRTYHMELGTEKDDISELVAYIREMRRTVNEGITASPAAETPMEKLEKLGELRENGVISADEFETKKADLLEDI